MEALPAFKLVRPHTIAEVMAACAQSKASRFLAGGTDLLAGLRRGLVQADTLIDLNGVAELHGIAADPHGVRIGAACSLESLLQNEHIAREYPAVAAAARGIAGATHRAVGTVGGNLCLDTRCRYYNQSESWRDANDYCLKLGASTCRVAPKSDRCYAAYSGDLAPALIVHGAVAEIVGSQGMRRCALADIYADDGAAWLRLARDELLVAIHLPPANGLVSAYDKVRTRGAIDFPLAGVAVALRHEGGQLRALHIATTGSDSRPLVIEGLDDLPGLPLEQALETLEKRLRKQVGPMETTLSPATYRRRVVTVLARRLILQLLKPHHG